MKKRVAEIFEESISLKRAFLNENLEVLERIILGLAHVLEGGHKVLLFGNGGSAADAQHIAAEFVNRYLIDRPPLPAIALTTDSSVLTSIANDFSFKDVFAKQIRAIGRSGDAAIGISTSGRSENVVRGLEVAREIGLITIGFGGPPGTVMQDVCEHYLCVKSRSTPRIQEVHQLIGHTVVEVVDQVLFGMPRA
ncbi:MAG: D-sedoheptulose 7-phosphate isomerase [Deltaproteobacteria bacterium]